MQISLRGFFLALILTPYLCSSSNAQSPSQIKSMKLLTADTGWAVTSKTLFYTADGGTHWRDITPKLGHKRQMVSSVFFLDSSTGWVSMRCSDDLDPIADDVCFEFALTADAGENWSIVHPKIVDPVLHSVVTQDHQGFSDAAFLNFSDSQHGWAVLVRNLPVERSSGEMLRTVDGGRTWTQLPKGSLPIAGNLRFINAKDGWMAGGPDQELYVTHDAGNSWQGLSLSKPADVGPDMGIDYNLPVFEDERHGFLAVRYAVGPLLGPDLSTLVLFATEDAGATWKQDRILPRVPNIGCSAVTDSILIASHSERKREPPSGSQYETIKTKLSLYTVGPNGSATSNTAEVPSKGAVTQLSFVGRDHGWANLYDGLYATQDAGKTWVYMSLSGTTQSYPCG